MIQSGLAKSKDYKVVKHNDLVQKVKFDLSEQEQKIIAYMCSRIKPTDERLEFVAFQLDEFYELTGATPKTIEGGSARSYLKTTIKALSDKSFWIKNDDGSETLCRWIHKATLDYGKNTILLRLDDDLLPYLLGISERFTQYELFWILKMKSGYSIRMYELLKSHAWRKTAVLFEVEELKKQLGADKVKSYTHMGMFLGKCIDKAIKEINELTDITVRYKKLKDGKNIRHLQFFIKEKTPDMKVKAIHANEQKAAKGGRKGQLHMETPDPIIDSYNKRLEMLNEGVYEEES